KVEKQKSSEKENGTLVDCISRLGKQKSEQKNKITTPKTDRKPT
ncbi:2394_t:CDS:1, partial [Gigaspora margarita]